MINRVYVEKKSGFDVAATNLATELNSVLKIKTNVRIFNRYDVFTDRADFQKAVPVVFSQPPIDTVLDSIDQIDGTRLCTRLLPGQFDARADSAAACMQMLCLIDKPKIKCATIYIFDKTLSDLDLKRIEKYIVNPVEAQVFCPQAEESDCQNSINNGKSKNEELNSNSNTSSSPLADTPIDGFIDLDLAKLDKFRQDYSLGFNLDDLLFIHKYFKKEGRNPYLVELKILEVYWSDHCRHTTFNTELKEIEVTSEMPQIAKSLEQYNTLFEKHYKKGKYKSLMSMATIATKELDGQGHLPHLDKSEEINACSVKHKIKVSDCLNPLAQPKLEDWTVMFKNETHNHPTEIEPFGGAATCLGGAIRDPLSGRAYVYQSMRVSGSANINEPHEATIKGKLPQRVITKTAASGFSSYGNQIGLATGLVKEIYDQGYKAKRLECGFVVGAAPSKNIKREVPKKGDLVLLIGGATGKDGIGGAAGSSKAHDKSSVENSGAEVQKGNAIIERKLQRLFSTYEFSKLIKRSNDFGAGGVSVAVGEIADSVDIFLDEIEQKSDKMSGIELAISESQERMAVVIDEKDFEKVVSLCKTENLKAFKIAIVSGLNRMRMFFNGQTIVDLDREFLNSSGIVQSTSALIDDMQVSYFKTQDLYFGDCEIDYLNALESSAVCLKNKCDCDEKKHDDLAASLDRRVQKISQASDNLKAKKFGEILTDLLKHPSNASQKGMGDMFDNSIGSSSVLLPFGGKNQLTPSIAMAALLPIFRHKTGSDLFFIDEQEKSENQEPALAKNGKGQDPLSVYSTNAMTVAANAFYPKLSAQSPFVAAQYAVLLSVIKACVAGANYDTIYLSFQEYFQKLASDPKKWGKVTGALLGALTAQLALKKAAIGGKDSMSGSFEDIHVPPTLISFALGLGQASNAIHNVALSPDMQVYHFKLEKDRQSLPDFDWAANFLKEFEKVRDCIEFINVAEEGGAATALAKSLMGEGLGFEFKNKFNTDLFLPALGDLVFGIKPNLTKDDKKRIESFVISHNCVLMGKTKQEPTIVFEKGNEIDLSQLINAFTCTNEDVFPTVSSHSDNYTSQQVPKINYHDGQIIFSKSKFAKPKVFIPVFPGTNCEDDTAKAFLNAGANVEIFIIKNLNASDIANSVSQLKKHIDRCNILALPGGFSAADEPDGSGKFIATSLLSPQVKDAINELLYKRDGLALGICNGFQALIKLGLLPYGKIEPLRQNSPTLTFNNIGRHVSPIVKIRIASNLSPWLKNVRVDEVFSQPVSHGEGRFFADSDHLERLIKGGQVATQYVDFDNMPTLKEPFNPNGSVLAIEGITSIDGRVLGKMGHSERIGTDLYKNHKGNWDLGIFKAGVDYFK